MQSKKNTTIWIVMIVLFLIAVAAAGGVWFWQQKKIDSLQKDVSDLRTKQELLEGDDAASTDLQTGQSQTVTYKIDQIGMTITVPQNLSDIAATTMQSSDTASYKVLGAVGLTTKALMAKDGNCSSGLGILGKVEGEYPLNANVNNALGKKVYQGNGYYIGYVAPQSACSENAEAQALQTQQLKLVQSIVTKLKEAQ